MMELTMEQIRYFRLHAHHLDRFYEPADLISVTGACGLQNTPPGAWETALFNRIPAYSKNAARQLLADKSLLQAWSIRGLPLVFPSRESDVFLSSLSAAEDEPWIYTKGISLALELLEMDFDEVLDLLLQVMPQLDHHIITSKAALDETIAGWLLLYFFKVAAGEFRGLDAAGVENAFGAMQGNVGIQLLFMGIVVVLGMLICSRGLKNGVEKVNKAMMLCLLALLVVLAVRALTLPGAMEGVKFYLVPNFHNLMYDADGSFRLFRAIYDAMGQAFFTLSLGIGAMAIFGSYIGKERRLFGEAINVGVLDTCVAFVSGLIIFPSAFAFGVNPGQGPSLIFVTLPNVFNAMPGGQLWGALFFVFLFFAALSTVTAVFENILACWMDRFGISRGRAVLANLVLIFLLSLPCLLGNNLWSGVKALGMGIMDWEDFLVSNNLLPIGSMIYLLFCCVSKKYGWGYDHFLEEANQGRGVRFPAQFRLYFKYVLPVIVLIIFIMGYWDKFKPFIVAALGA